MEVRLSLERLKEKLRKQGLTLQPLIILAGPLAKIDKAYVCVNDILYSVDSVLDAIDLCFKTFIVFDSAYPVKSEKYWTVIQKSIYEIDFPTDSTYRSANVLIGEIKGILSN